MTKEYVNAAEAGEIIHRSEKTIRRWIERGLLKAEKVHDRLYAIHIEDLQNLQRALTLGERELEIRVVQAELKIKDLEGNYLQLLDEVGRLRSENARLYKEAIEQTATYQSDLAALRRVVEDLVQAKNTESGPAPPGQRPRKSQKKAPLQLPLLGETPPESQEGQK